MSNLTRLLAKCRQLGIELPGDDSEYKLRRVRGSRGRFSGTFAWALQPLDVNRWGELMPQEVSSYEPETYLLKHYNSIVARKSGRANVDHGWILYLEVPEPEPLTPEEEEKGMVCTRCFKPTYENPDLSNLNGKQQVDIATHWLCQSCLDERDLEIAEENLVAKLDAGP